MRVKFIEGYGLRLTFELLNPTPLEIKPGVEYDLEIKKHRERRSLDANAYCWVLCSKIAEKVNTSKDEVYEEMLQKYGYMSDITITVKADVDMRRIDGHWKFYQESGDGRFKAYVLIRGSSEYDSKEMAHFIDMIIDEAKDLDIETMTPDQIEQIKKSWNNRKEINDGNDNELRVNHA